MAFKIWLYFRVSMLDFRSVVVIVSTVDLTSPWETGDVNV